MILTRGLLCLVLGVGLAGCGSDLGPAGPPPPLPASYDVLIRHRPAGADGRVLRRVTLDGALGPSLTVRHPDVLQFNVSPVSPSVAFVATRPVFDPEIGEVNLFDLFVIDAEGEETNLTRAEERFAVDDLPLFTDPAWSPDGSRVAYTGPGAEPGRDILIVTSDGTDRRVLAETPEPERSPAWAPDGGRITHRALPVEEEGWWLRAAPSGGGTPTRLGEGLFWVGGHAWAPDGSLIAFDAALEPDPDALPKLFVVDPAGSEVTGLAPEDPDGTIVGMFHPTWHPDGDRLAATAIVESGTENGNRRDVVILDRSGTLLRRVDLGERDLDPAFSPDGAYLAFRTSDAGEDELHVLVLERDEFISLTGGGQIQGLQWIERR